jgi:hypothetical protein
MKWARWLTEKALEHSSSIATVKTNTAASIQQAASAHATVATVVEKTAAQEAVNPSVPIGPPQVPSAPTLTTDHGTVSIFWNGLVHGNGSAGSAGALMEPAVGFNHVSAYRGDTQSGPWTSVGGFIRKDGSIVDVDVKVGLTYWYYLVTTDNANYDSAPSDLTSIVVKGVDLGSLDADVKQALADAQDAANAGADAATAGAAAAQAANDAANSSAMQAAQALKNANGAISAMANKNRIIYATTPPATQSGDGDNGNGTWTRTDFTDNGDGTWTATSNITDNGDGTWTAGAVTNDGSSSTYTDGDLWFQLDANGVIIAQWQFMGTIWVAQMLSGSVIAVRSISASQIIAGTITAASGVLGDAVIGTAQIANLAVNNAKIADLAVNDAKINDLNGNKITASSIVAGKLAANSVTTNNIIAGAIDTNRLAAGAITADKLSLGAVQQKGDSVQRVPARVTDTTYWTSVANGATPGFSYRQAGVSTSGLTLAAGGSNGQRMSLTAQNIPVPVSRKITVSVAFSGATLAFYARTFDATGVFVSEVQIPNNGSYTFGSSVYGYEVFVANFATTASLVYSANVFEITGANEGNGQAAQLSPAGLQLFDANGQLAVDLTTNASQYLSIVDNTAAEPQIVAAIDQNGNGAFESVSTDSGFDIQGVDLTDMSDPLSLYNSTPNGSTWAADTPLFDRLARGVIYDVTWQSLNDRTIPAGYSSFRIAQDSFVLEDGRQYMFNLQSGGLQMVNPGNANMYLELQVSTTPITNITTGVNISRGIVPTNATAAFVTQSPVFTAATGASLNNQQRTMPAGVPIYWQLDVSGSSAANDWKLSEFGYSRGLSIIDVGANNINRPDTGADTLPDVSNFVNIAAGGSAPAGGGSAGTTATSKTVTFTATQSRTWNQGGSNIVTGSGQYTNGNAMYYGHGASDMGSWFGNFDDSSGRSLNSVVGGKTITSATLTVKNTYTYGPSGATVQMGTASSDTAPDTIGTPASNTFNATFTNGGTKSISLNSAIRAGLKSGSVKSFVIGVSGSTSNYSYFHGANQSSPPKLTVTFH